MTPSEIREKTSQELKTLLADLREELFRLRMQDGTGQLEKTHRLKEVRKDLARVQTILGEKARRAEATAQ